MKSLVTYRFTHFHKERHLVNGSRSTNQDDGGARGKTRGIIDINVEILHFKSLAIHAYTVDYLLITGVNCY